jgi:hypothetical protein
MNLELAPGSAISAESVQKIQNLADWRIRSHAVSAWKERAENTLLNLEPHETDASSNGERDATEPLSKDLLNSAQEFLSLLPLDIEPPSISADPAGGILFEWYKKEGTLDPTILSVVIKEHSVLFSYLRNGTPINHAAFSQSYESLSMILPTIRSGFGILRHAPRFRA